MKKITTSTIIIIAFFIYAFFHNKSQEVSALPSSNIKDTPTPTQSSDQLSEITQFPTAIPTQTIISAQFKDGVYTGPAVDAFYGNIQVRATIKNGKLVDVEFLQYPGGHNESIEINSAAMPILREEAIQAQSANVDTVTRATDSSEAFRISLGNALSQAKS